MSNFSVRHKCVEEETMAKRLYTRLALTVATLLFFAAPATAQRPLGANQLPASGVVNYQGTLTSTDFSTPISLTVDFGSGSVQAAFTIPALNTNGTTSTPWSFDLSGAVDSEGSFLIGTGGFFIESSGSAFLAGNFFNGQTQNIAGVFIAQFCLPATTVPCPGIVTRSGSYEAARMP
jgi:hypothetical protein